jgi:hypothetical protein
MPSGTLTITAPTGAGSSVSALVLTNVRNINFDTARAVLAVTLQDDTVRSFDINATTTITATAASGVFTFTVAQ